MSAISQTTLLNAFSRRKLLEFRIKFPWNSFVGAKLKNITALVGTKPLSEPIVVGLPTNIWIARLQWVNCLHLDWNEVNGVLSKYNLFISKLFEMMPSCNFASQTSASYLYMCRYDSSTPYHGHSTTRLLARVEFKEQISNFTPDIIMDVITYPCWD